jgi:transcription-repair coupling factor (superfamily II helicase)
MQNAKLKTNLIEQIGLDLSDKLDKEGVISFEGSNNETGKILLVLKLMEKHDILPAHGGVSFSVRRGNKILSRYGNKNILWISGDDKRADKIFFDLKRMKIETKRFELVDQDREDDFPKLIDRQKILIDLVLKKSQIIVTDAYSLFQKIAGEKDLLKDQIKIGKKLLQSEVIKKLSHFGYKREDRVILEGDFSLRGDVIDIFTLQNKNPLRIELFNDRVEKIYSFDQISGDKIKDFPKVQIIPVKTEKSDKTILEYFDQEDLIIFDEPDQIANILQSLNIIDAHILKFSQLQTKLLKNRIIYFQPLLGFSLRAKKYELDYFRPGQYQGDIRRFINDLKSYSFNNFKIYFACEDHLKIEEILKNKNINYSFLPYNLPIGLISKKEKIAIYTDSDIFGKKVVFKSLIPTEQQKKEVEKFRPADYLVHIDHGVGRFLKTEQLVFADSQKPTLYIIIEYAGGDRLYLPTTNVKKISKYIGVEGINIRLSKLGSSSWLRSKEKIQNSANKIAQELLQIYAIRKIRRGFRFLPKWDWENILINSFEYRETEDQIKAVEDVYRDMESAKSMDRLICGDVGFGKTEVAIRAAARTVANGKQVAVICPTTILTEQHLVTFKKRLEKLPVRLESLSRFKSRKIQQKILKELKEGKIDIIVGTHRLLQDDIYFCDLGLVIIDEEQRFGVKHKERLKTLRAEVDVLTLSATPIPRTLYLAFAGIKEISKIQTPPQGRLPIETKISQYDDALVKSAILKEIKRHGQIYFIHNKIETIYWRASKLREILPKNIKIGIVHGQLRAKDLARVMADFIAKKYDVLLATTIVENGLDLSNVNTLIVERADKFGLSELYQLRGRVGRGDIKAYAYFTVPNQVLTDNARKRLMVLLESRDLGSGFMVAERDLEIRGGGNILGKEQSGHIAEVGLTLYSQLLKEAVNKLKT